MVSFYGKNPNFRSGGCMGLGLDVARTTLCARLYMLSSPTRVTSNESVLVCEDTKSNQAHNVTLVIFQMIHDDEGDIVGLI